MSQIVILFHSALGLRPAVHRFAKQLRAQGHTVHTPDLYDGQVFDDLGAGIRKRDSVGFEELLKRATSFVSGLPVDIVYAGFSLGAAPAQLLAATRPGARGAVLMHGAIAPAMLGLKEWPKVPVQMHYSIADPWVDAEQVDSLAEAVRHARQVCEIHRYDGASHLFADEDSPDYDPPSAKAMMDRVIAFLAGL